MELPYNLLLSLAFDALVLSAILCAGATPVRGRRARQAGEPAGPAVAGVLRLCGPLVLLALAGVLGIIALGGAVVMAALATLGGGSFDDAVVFYTAVAVAVAVAVLGGAALLLRWGIRRLDQPGGRG